ncbi:hypothetical protein [Helicobacter cetorum]|uniref:hypothetical protein n=1 Tax=Helicobacter cetorum TaxID=138563 RepID=UPI000CF155EF|nr:hypothetical protein [Helicobacter cetorum]
MNKEQIRAMIKERKENYLIDLSSQFEDIWYRIVEIVFEELVVYLREKREGIRVEYHLSECEVEIDGFIIHIALREYQSFVAVCLTEGDGESTKKIILIQCDILEQFNIKYGLIDALRSGIGFNAQILGDFVLRYFEENKQDLLKRKEEIEKDRQVEEEFFKSVINLVSAKIPTDYQANYRKTFTGGHGELVREFYISRSCDDCVTIRASREFDRKSWAFTDNYVLEMCCRQYLMGENEERIKLEDSLFNLIKNKQMDAKKFASIVLEFFEKHKEYTTQICIDRQAKRELLKPLITQLQKKFRGSDFYVYQDDFAKGCDISTMDKNAKEFLENIDGRHFGDNKIKYEWFGHIMCRLGRGIDEGRLQEILQQTEPHYKETMQGRIFDERDLKKELDLETLEVENIPKVVDYIYAYCLEHKEWLTQTNKLYEEAIVLMKDFFHKTHEILKEKFKDEPNWELIAKNECVLYLTPKSDKEDKLVFLLLKIAFTKGRRFGNITYGIVQCAVDCYKMAYLINDGEQEFNAYRDDWLDDWLDYGSYEKNLEKSFLESLEDKSLNAENYSAFVYDYFKKRQDKIEVLNENIEEFFLEHGNDIDFLEYRK